MSKEVMDVLGELFKEPSYFANLFFSKLPDPQAQADALAFVSTFVEAHSKKLNVETIYSAPRTSKDDTYDLIIGLEALDKPIDKKTFGKLVKGLRALYKKDVFDGWDLVFSQPPQSVVSLQGMEQYSF